jgi:hypothetical protein
MFVIPLCALFILLVTVTKTMEHRDRNRGDTANKRREEKKKSIRVSTFLFYLLSS